MAESAADTAAKPTKPERAYVVADDEMLSHVRVERQQSIGFGEGDSGELVKRRERALLYYKGDVREDLPDPPNRSRAVSTDVAEAIDTALPDLAEIFLSGEDIVTFTPEGEEDEAQAREETDFVQRVLFQQNPGFVIITTAMKDALLSVTGLFHWWYEEEEASRELGVLSPEQANLAPAVEAQLGQSERLQVEQQEDGSVSFSLPQLKGRVCYRAIPPEDFTVAQDTVTLAEGTYCAYRERARVQALIERGLDAEKVRKLPEFSRRDESVDRARDEAGETDRGMAGSTGDLRVVEIRNHYLRIDRDGDGETELWRVVTDADEQVLLDLEEVDHIPFSALTPYMSAHRFYGESVADRLLEIMRIKTSLLRMMLDSGFFALNQRMAVAMDGANDFTIPDLLRNEPNVPVRMRSVGAVTPLQAGQLGFDVFGALEYASVMGEQRTGIVRNAQGLNPDTLHDTASGAMQLINAAQKRLRFIARVFAETGIKELCLGIHRTMRVNWTDQHAPVRGKFGKQWKTAQPHQWPERDDMEVHVGPVSKDHELAMLSKQMEILQSVIQLQGGTQGPFVSEANVHNLLTAWSRAAGQKSPEQYWTDPQSPEVQQAKAQQQPKPDPEMAKVQAQIAAQNQKAQADVQLAREKAAADLQLQREKHAADGAAAEAQAAREHELRLQEHAADVQLRREQMAGELQLKRDGMVAELALKREMGARPEVQGPEVGGEPG
jgi:hypothetical protein